MVQLRHGDRTQEYDLIYLLLTFDLLKHFALSQVEGRVNKRYLGMIFSVRTRFSSTSEKIKTDMAAHELLSRLLGFFGSLFSDTLIIFGGNTQGKYLNVFGCTNILTFSVDYIKFPF